MISAKSQREIKTMKQAGKIVALARQACADALKPGITTEQLDRIAEEVIRAQGATPSFKGYGGFPGTICASINSELVHGIPNQTVLKNGDIISIDIGACYNGYHGDASWTFPVGEISDDNKRLLEVGRQALFAGLEQAKPGNHLGDISHAIGEFIDLHGYSFPFDLTGHGIGTHLHEEPAIPNFGEAGTGLLLEEGMTFAIEPIVLAGKPHTKVLADDWTVVTKDGSLAAHFEHTIVITKDGYEILTINHDEEENSIYGKTRCH